MKIEDENMYSLQRTVEGGRLMVAFVETRDGVSQELVKLPSHILNRYVRLLRGLEKPEKNRI